jgi:hypothetical protein
LSGRADMAAELRKEIEFKRISADRGQAVSFSEVAELKVRLDEVMKLGNPHQGEETEVQDIRNCLFDMETLAVALQDKPDVHGLRVSEEVAVIEWGLDASFELCLVAHPELVEVYMSSAKQLTSRLVERMEAGLVQDVGGVLYYDFKRAQFEALAALNIMNDAAAKAGGESPETSVINKAQDGLAKAARTWHKMRENSMLRASSGSTIVSEGSQVLENFGIMQCEQGQLDEGISNIKEAQDLIWAHWARTAGIQSGTGKELLDLMPTDVRMGLVGSYYNLAVCVEGKGDREPSQAISLTKEAAEHVAIAQRILSSVYPDAGTGSIGGLERVVHGAGSEEDRALFRMEAEEVRMMWGAISQRAEHLRHKLERLSTPLEEKRKVVRKKRKSRSSTGK